MHTVDKEKHTANLHRVLYRYRTTFPTAGGGGWR